MYDREMVFPDDVPIADAAEQQLPTHDSAADEQLARDHVGEVPLEASAADWQEQQETVVFDPELDERDQ